jgi:glycosyltransferase involved in cell wall biosynthesis
MPDAPHVSVIMPVYNAETHLTQAIDSILNQSFRDFEFVVIDDGSTDTSQAILKAIADRDRRLVIYTQPNRGLIASLNEGWKIARGTYIARMDADDISLPRRLEKQVAYLDRNRDVGIVGTWIQDIGRSGEAGPVWPLPTSPGTIPWFLMFGNCMAHPSVMMRREVVAKLGYRTAAIHVEDYDLWMRASAVTRLANIPEVLLKYRVLSHSVSSRNLLLQEEQAGKLQCELRAAVLGSAEDVHKVTKDLLLKLYSSYRKRNPMPRGDDSEIVLDVVRRMYLSNEIRRHWTSLLPLIPRVLSFQSACKVVRFGTSYVSNINHGYTTQRRVAE